MFEDLQKLLDSGAGGTLFVLYLAFGAISGVAGAVGGALGAYFKHQAESLARAHAFEQILDELRKTTALAEEIKTEVSHGVWLRQKAWEMRREVYSGILRHLDALGYTLSVNTDDSGAVDGNDEVMNDLSLRVGAVRDLLPDLTIHGSPEARQVIDALADDWNGQVQKDPGANLAAAKRLTDAARKALRLVARAELGLGGGATHMVPGQAPQVDTSEPSSVK